MSNEADSSAHKQNQEYTTNAGNVFQPTWFRRIVQTGDGLDRFLLDYGCNFLLHISCVSWIVFLLIKIFQTCR